MAWCRLSIEGHNMKMKRRDFNRIALGMGLSPLLASSALAQATTQTKGASPTPPQNFNIVIKNTPRTYNQINVPRKYVAGSGGSVFIGPGVIRGSPIAT